MKRLKLLAYLLLTCYWSSGQEYTSARSHVVEKIYLDPTTAGTPARTVSNVVYLDGFGRKLQTIQVQGSPGGTADVVVPHAYGVAGRVEREYLPFSRAGNNGKFVPDALASSNWSHLPVDDRGFAFTLTGYDNSPLDRVMKKTGPGKSWQGAGKGVETSYGTNPANAVRLYRVNVNSGNLVFDGYYAPGTLVKTTVKDEDGKETVTYTSNDGNTVLVANHDGTGWLETYSVYDDRGLLRHVLSPEASVRLGTTINEGVLSQLAYRYDYDRWGRLIEKRLPGCSPVYMVYDKRDRLVMSQDGKQRDEHPNKWSYSLYDNQNRVVETGEVTLSTSTPPESLRSAAFLSDNYIPAGTRYPLQYSLYDTYTATSAVPVIQFRALAGYSSSCHPLVTGLVTSVKTRILGGDTWLTTTTYYDDRCRVIQVASQNLQGGVSRVDMQHDFVGNVVKQRESHERGGGTDVLETVNNYDTRGRLLSSTTRLNGGSPATVARGYDAVGRLVSVTRGTLVETLAYNARGWLTGKDSAPFKMKLRYGDPAGGSVACWNGNISEWEWQQGAGAALMYGFTYDGVNRLKETMQKQKSGTTWSTLSGSYLEKGVSYDRNGNIKTLQRTAAGSTVDNLSYVYTGNQLTGLTESVRTAPTGDIYSPGSVAAGTYGYDKNGNMVNDSRRALNFGYNVLNLLSEVKTSSGTLKARYSYLGDGTKLRVRDNGEVNGFDYLASLTYRKSSSGLQLETASFGEGVIRMTGSNSGLQEVDYFLTDHLGSVRVIVDGNGVVKERNDYYPFGAEHTRSDYPQKNGNRYKYNGKEEQVTGDLKYLDYGARMYDSGLGRWFGMDPLSENYLSESPYHFSGNNPVIFVDPNGMDYWSTNDPNLIASFLFGLKSGWTAFDFSAWNHATDAEFTGNLTYNDETNRYYTYYGTEIKGVATVIGCSFEAVFVPTVNSMPYEGAFVREPLSGFWQNLGYYTGIGGYDTYPGIVGEWNVNREGRLTGVESIKLVGPDVGSGKGGLLKAGKIASKGLPHGDGGRALSKIEKQIKDLEEQLKTATGKSKKEIKNKIKNILENAQKKAKGETHWRK